MDYDEEMSEVESPGSKQGPYVDDRSKPINYYDVGKAAKGAFGGLVDLIVGLINVIRLLKK